MLARTMTAAVACLALNGQPGLAGETDADPATPEHRFAVGIGHWGALNPMQGAPEDPGTGFFPWVAYENEWLSLDPSGLSVKLPFDGPIQMEAQVAPRWLLVDPADSTLHHDLRRRTSLDLGARVLVPWPSGFIALGYLTDVSGRIGGHEVTAEAAYGIGLPGNGQLGFKAGAYWRDADLNTYLYGVFPGEARQDRPAWRIGARFTPFAGLMVGYPLPRGFEVMFAAEAEYLTGRAAASPLIARRVVPSAFIGLFYRF